MEYRGYTLQNVAVLYGDAAEYARHLHRHVSDWLDPALSDPWAHFGNHNRAGYHEWLGFLDAGQLFEEEGRGHGYSEFFQADCSLELWGQVGGRGYHCSRVRCACQMNRVIMITSCFEPYILLIRSPRSECWAGYLISECSVIIANRCSIYGYANQVYLSTL